MSRLPFDLLVFDWDGTLMDSEAQIVACLQAAASECGLPELDRNRLRNVIGLGLMESAQSLYPDAAADIVQRFIDSYRKHFLGTGREAAGFFPGVSAMLAALNELGYLMAVATGKSRRGLDRSLDETNSRELFHCTRCADEAFSKPHPRMLLDIMDLLGVEPARTLMIGDTEYDMLMAQGAGTASLAVSHGVHDRERLLSHGPLACLDDVSTLVTWLNQC